MNLMPIANQVQFSDSATATPFRVGTNCAILTATFTRPADTTAYAALDAVSNSTSAPTIMTFAGAARSVGGSGYIVKAELCTDLATCTAYFRLHLFTLSTIAAKNDNAQYDSLWTSRNARVGFIDFPACAQEGTGSTSAFAIVIPSSGTLPYVCDVADTALYGLLQTRSIWTPASAQNFNLKLMVDKN